jgi:hypothetical protein
MPLTLAILAAGLGRRFGGNKQLAEVGPTGETLLDYTLYDAEQAGFDRVVCIVRRELEDVCRAALEPRWNDRFEWAYAHQELDDLPNGIKPPTSRSRPWGTGHAVLCLARHVDTPFAVVNADDFYGRSAFALLANMLSNTSASHPPLYGLVTYALLNTLPHHGQVNRAICRMTAQGHLTDIEEIVGIQRQGQQGLSNTHGRLAGDTPVSMNIWGFTPQVFGQLEANFREFLADSSNLEAGEFYLPSAVNDWIQSQQAIVQTFASPDQWCGLTHPEDRAAVSAFLGELIARGEYPSQL